MFWSKMGHRERVSKFQMFYRSSQCTLSTNSLARNCFVKLNRFGANSLNARQMCWPRLCWERFSCMGKPLAC